MTSLDLHLCEKMGNFLNFQRKQSIIPFIKNKGLIGGYIIKVYAFSVKNTYTHTHIYIYIYIV